MRLITLILAIVFSFITASAYAQERAQIAVNTSSNQRTGETTLNEGIPLVLTLTELSSPNTIKLKVGQTLVVRVPEAFKDGFNWKFNTKNCNLITFVKKEGSDTLDEKLYIFKALEAGTFEFKGWHTQGQKSAEDATNKFDTFIQISN